MRPYRVEPLILTAGYVGLRWGELAGLRVSRLRLLERKLNVVETVVKVSGHLTSGPPKTGDRTVTLPRYIVDALAEHLARFPAPLMASSSLRQRGLCSGEACSDGGCSGRPWTGSTSRPFACMT
jgi:integrase